MLVVAEFFLQPADVVTPGVSKGAFDFLLAVCGPRDDRVPVGDCNKWAIVMDSLTCTDLASQAGHPLQQFLAWSPAVSSDCRTN